MKKSPKKPARPRDEAPPASRKQKSGAKPPGAARAAATPPPKRATSNPKRSPKPRTEVCSDAELSEAGRKLRAARYARPQQRKTKSSKKGS